MNIEIIDGVEYTNVGTHVTHCCAQHGCKYGNKNCVVEDGKREQEFACEFCHSSEYLKNKIANLQEELEWTEKLEARGLTVSGYDEDW